MRSISHKFARYMFLIWVDMKYAHVQQLLLALYCKTRTRSKTWANIQWLHKEMHVAHKEYKTFNKPSISWPLLYYTLTHEGLQTWRDDDNMQSMLVSSCFMANSDHLNLVTPKSWRNSFDNDQLEMVTINHKHKKTSINYVLIANCSWQFLLCESYAYMTLCLFFSSECHCIDSTFCDINHNK